MKRIYVFALLIIFGKLSSAQGWSELSMYSRNGIFVKATSELTDPNQSDHWVNERYGVFNLIDANSLTAWVEGKPNEGISESVFVSIPKNCQTINIYNGYGKSISLFNQNNRVKKLKLSLQIGINPVGYISEVAHAFLLKTYPESFTIELNDTDSLQSFPFPISSNELLEFIDIAKKEYLNQYTEPIYLVTPIVQFEIIEIFKGLKYNDTCLSEIFFNDSFIPNANRFKYNEIKNVYTQDGDDSKVLIDCNEGKGSIIIEDSESVFQVIDISSNNEWATIIRMPADIGYGRVETEYHIVNTRLGKIMNTNIENSSGINLLGPLFLKEKDGVTILEYTEGEICLR